MKISLPVADIGLRATKTGLQSFIAVVTANGLADFDMSTLESAALSGGAALLSAIQNGLNAIELNAVAAHEEKVIEEAKNGKDIEANPAHGTPGDPGEHNGGGIVPTDLG